MPSYLYPDLEDSRACHCGARFKPSTPYHSVCAACTARAKARRAIAGKVRGLETARKLEGVGPCRVCGTQACATARALGRPLLCD